MKKVKVYQACSWFNDKQRKLKDEVDKALRENKTVDYENSYRPLDFQFKGINIDENPEFLNKEYQRIAWGYATYNNDISGMNNSDVGVFAYHPEAIDDGQAFEMGYLNAINKPTVLVLPNGKYEDANLNLMLAYGITNVVEVKDLKDLNLNKIINKTFDGGIY